MVDEMELVSGLAGAAPMRDAAFEEARARLRETMGPAGEPRRRPGHGRHQPRRRTWAIWSMAGLGVAATAAAVTLVITPAAQPAQPRRPAAWPARPRQPGRTRR